MPSFDYYEMNEDAVNDGAWFTLPNGIEVKVAKLGNKAYRSLKEKLEKPYRKLITVGGKIPDEKADEIMVELISKTLLKGWKKYEDGEGNEIAFSVEKAKEELTKYETLRDHIVTFALSEDTFRVEREAAAKN